MPYGWRSAPDATVRARVLGFVTKRVRDEGWTGIYTPFDGHPIEYGYTVGLTETFGFPEAVILGVGPAVANQAFAALAGLLRTGRAPALHQPVDVGLTFPVVLRPIPPATARLHLKVANAFYEGRRAYSAVQLVWPDAEGRFPWEAGHQVIGSYQPLLSPGPPPE